MADGVRSEQKISLHRVHTLVSNITRALQPVFLLQLSSPASKRHIFSLVKSALAWIIFLLFWRRGLMLFIKTLSSVFLIVFSYFPCFLLCFSIIHIHSLWPRIC